MAELFGFKFERTGNTSSEEKFTEPSSEDGTLEVAGGGFYGQLLDTDGRERTEHDLIRRYRDIAQQPECDSAIEDIINEGIVANERDQAVAIILDRIAYPKKIKDRIREEFDTVLELLDFDTKGHDIFRRWYVDGRLFYHKVIDQKNPKKGIQEVRYIEVVEEIRWGGIDARPLVTQVAERERLALGQYWRAIANYSVFKKISSLTALLDAISGSSAGTKGQAEANIDRNSAQLSGDAYFLFGEDGPLDVSYHYDPWEQDLDDLYDRWFAQMLGNQPELGPLRSGKGLPPAAEDDRQGERSMKKNNQDAPESKP